MSAPSIPYGINGTSVEVGGRKLALAVAQSQHIRLLIVAAHPELEVNVLALSTLGDHIQNRPLYLFAGKALWTKELEILLLESVHNYAQLDLIVHLLKDMPTNLPEEFELGAITEREGMCERVPRDDPTTKMTLDFLTTLRSDDD